MAKMIDAKDIQISRPVGKPSKKWLDKTYPAKVPDRYMDYRGDMIMLHDDLAEKRAELRKKMQNDRAKEK